MSEVALSLLRDERATNLVAMMEEGGATNGGCFHARYRDRDYQAIRTREPYGEREDGSTDYRWHVSVSAIDSPEEPPPWDAFVAVVHAVRPGVAFIVPLPVPTMWLNVHQGTLHAVEVNDENMTKHWRANATGQAPS